MQNKYNVIELFAGSGGLALCLNIYKKTIQDLKNSNFEKTLSKLKKLNQKTNEDIYYEINITINHPIVK